MSKIKEHYFQQIERQQQQDRGLAGEFWPDNEPAMIIPPAHFSGSYPVAPTSPKVCKTRGYISGAGQTAVKLVKAHFSQWRGYTHQKSGAYIRPCQHCRHERVLKTCEHIERASFQYSGPNLMRWQSVTQAEKRRLSGVIRKRNQRGEALSYTPFPLSDGRFILLHDAPNIGGQALPQNRKQLFSLVSGWVLDTPKGKRAGRGLATWGKSPNKPKKQQGGKNSATQEKPSGKPWRLIVENYSAVLRELMAYEGGEMQKKSFSIPIAQIIDRLDAAGIAWAVESGELPPNVTLKRDIDDTPISLKCDIPPDKDDKTAFFSQPQFELHPKKQCFLHTIGVTA